jgi:hypothetical protein
MVAPLEPGADDPVDVGENGALAEVFPRHLRVPVLVDPKMDPDNRFDCVVAPRHPSTYF